MASQTPSNGGARYNHGLTRSYSSFLKKHNFEILDVSVHGKNQTRFLHFVLKKDGQKYFCKANTYDLYERQVNAGLTRYLGKPPQHVRFLAPMEILEKDDTLFHIYPYVDQEPVSNEAKDFEDFNVPPEDIDTYLQRMLDAIAFVENQQIVTAHEQDRALDVETEVLKLLRTLPGDTPYAIDLLQLLLSEKSFAEYRLAIVDTQPQNTFWLTNSKTLVLFDLEDTAPRPRYYDHAKFFAQLWVVYGRETYARRFMEMLFLQLHAAERGNAYRYIRFNMAYEALRSYKVFGSVQQRKRTTALMRWLRNDLLELANEPRGGA